MNDKKVKKLVIRYHFKKVEVYRFLLSKNNKPPILREKQLCLFVSVPSVPLFYSSEFDTLIFVMI